MKDLETLDQKLERLSILKNKENEKKIQDLSENISNLKKNYSGTEKKIQELDAKILKLQEQRENLVRKNANRRKLFEELTKQVDR